MKAVPEGDGLADGFPGFDVDDFSRFVLVLTVGVQKAWRLLQLATLPEDGQRGHCAEGKQDAPDEVVREMCGQQRGRKQRSDDQACRLHREDQRHHHAAVVLARILAHYGRADRVVAADADTQNEAQSDQPEDIRRKRAGDGAHGQHQHFDAINALAAEHIGNAPEEQRSQRRCQQGR